MNGGDFKIAPSSGYRPLRERGIGALDAAIRAKQSERVAVEAEIDALKRARSILQKMGQK